MISSIPPPRTRRNEILYTELTGLVDISVDVKSYIKSISTASSPEYKAVSGLNFTRGKQVAEKPNLFYEITFRKVAKSDYEMVFCSYEMEIDDYVLVFCSYEMRISGYEVILSSYKVEMGGY